MHDRHGEAAAPENPYAVAVLDMLEQPLWIFDLDKLRKVWANPAALAFWSAASLEELRQRDFSQDITLATLDKHQAYRRRFAEEGRVTIRETWTFYPGGKPETIVVKIRPLKLSDGALGIICELEAKAKVAPENARAIDALTHSLAMVATYSIEGDLLFANPAARRSLPRGYLKLEDRFEDAAAFAHLMSTVMAGQRFEGELQVKTGGSLSWHHITAERRHDPVTGATGILVSEMDVTEARAAQQLVESARRDVSLAQSRLWACIEELPEGIVMFDRDDRLVACNKAYRDLLPGAAPALVPGATFEELTRTSLSNAEFPEAYGREDEWLEQRLLQHRFPSSPIDIRTLAGRVLRIRECRTDLGEHFGIQVDLTEQMATKAQIDALEQRLRHARTDAEQQGQTVREMAQVAFAAQARLNEALRELEASRSKAQEASAAHGACMQSLRDIHEICSEPLDGLLSLLRELDQTASGQTSPVIETATAKAKALRETIARACRATPSAAA